MSGPNGRQDAPRLIDGMLRAGFGSEDIVLKLRRLGVDIGIVFIRKYIAGLRKSGTLREVLGN